MRGWLVMLGSALLLSAGAATAAAVPGPARLPKTFLPSALSFWSTESGIIAGVDPSANRVYLATTSDAGRTWRVRLRIPEGALYVADVFVATSSRGRGWLTVETCLRQGGYPFGRCRIRAVETVDGGARWTAGGPQSVSFSFAGRDGWAIVARGAGLLQARLYRLTATGGGLRLRRARVAAPCSGDLNGEGPALGAVAAFGGRQALLVCTGPQGTLASAVTVQPKHFYATSDGGRTWHAVLTVPPSATASGLGLGALLGMTFLPDGRGWLWSARGGLYATRDWGRSWTLDHLVQEREVEEALSVSFVDDRTGYALLQGAPHGPYIRLMRTRDGGRHWTQVGGFTPAAAGHS